MNTHLSSDQICRWLAGDGKAEDQRHLRECAACQAEVEQFHSMLAGFGASVRNSPAPAIRRAARHAAMPRWILAAAALSILIGAPIYWNVRQQRAAEQAKADELLLDRVNAGLSRSVPASMEPLMLLISQKGTE